MTSSVSTVRECVSVCVSRCSDRTGMLRRKGENEVLCAGTCMYLTQHTWHVCKYCQWFSMGGNEGERGKIPAPAGTAKSLLVSLVGCIVCGLLEAFRTLAREKWCWVGL